MNEIRMGDRAGTKVLVSRPAAREFLPILELALAGNPEELVLNFEGVRVVAPSFLDELLLLIERAAGAGREGIAKTTLVLRNFPTGMDATLGAIGLAHDADVILDEQGSWVLRRSA